MIIRDRFISLAEDFIDRLGAGWQITMRSYHNTKPSQLFVCFIPNNWLHWERQFGIHYEIEARPPGGEKVTLSMGVENPLAHEFRKEFKLDILSKLGEKAAELIQQGYLLEATPRGKFLKKIINWNDTTIDNLIKALDEIESITKAVGELEIKYRAQGKFSNVI